MPRFHLDNEWQRAIRDAVLVPGFYGRIKSGRYVFMDKGRLSDILQKRYAVDTFIQADNGDASAIEEKIIRFPVKKGKPHTAFCLETRSCTVPGHESPGWMAYAGSVPSRWRVRPSTPPCGTIWR